MTLPASGELSFGAVGTEVGEASDIDLDSASVRSLAAIPSGQLSMSDLYGKTYVPSYVVHIGLSNVPIASVSQLLALPAYNILKLPHQFVLTAGKGQYMYWMSPVTLGPVQFYDRESTFIGGWDGADDDIITQGPSTVLTPNGPCYVYRTDYADLGRVPWEARTEV